MGQTTRFSYGLYVFGWFASLVALLLSAINHWAFALVFSFVFGSHFAMGMGIRFAFDLVEKYLQPPPHSQTCPSSESLPTQPAAAETLSAEASQ